MILRHLFANARALRVLHTTALHWGLRPLAVQPPARAWHWGL